MRDLREWHNARSSLMLITSLEFRSGFQFLLAVMSIAIKQKNIGALLIRWWTQPYQLPIRLLNLVGAQNGRFFFIYMPYAVVDPFEFEKRVESDRVAGKITNLEAYTLIYENKKLINQTYEQQQAEESEKRAAAARRRSASQAEYDRDAAYAAKLKYERDAPERAAEAERWEARRIAEDQRKIRSVQIEYDEKIGARYEVIKRKTASPVGQSLPSGMSNPREGNDSAVPFNPAPFVPKSQQKTANGTGPGQNFAPVLEKPRPVVFNPFTAAVGSAESSVRSGSISGDSTPVQSRSAGRPASPTRASPNARPVQGNNDASGAAGQIVGTAAGQLQGIAWESAQQESIIQAGGRAAWDRLTEQAQRELFTPNYQNEINRGFGLGGLRPSELIGNGTGEGPLGKGLKGIGDAAVELARRGLGLPDFSNPADPSQPWNDPESVRPSFPSPFAPAEPSEARPYGPLPFNPFIPGSPGGAAGGGSADIPDPLPVPVYPLGTPGVWTYAQISPSGNSDHILRGTAQLEFRKILFIGVFDVWQYAEPGGGWGNMFVAPINSGSDLVVYGFTPDVPVPQPIPAATPKKMPDASIPSPVPSSSPASAAAPGPGYSPQYSAAPSPARLVSPASSPQSEPLSDGLNSPDPIGSPGRMPGFNPVPDPIAAKNPGVKPGVKPASNPKSDTGPMGGSSGSQPEFNGAKNPSGSPSPGSSSSTGSSPAPGGGSNPNPNPGQSQLQCRFHEPTAEKTETIKILVFKGCDKKPDGSNDYFSELELIVPRSQAVAWKKSLDSQALGLAQSCDIQSQDVAIPEAWAVRGGIGRPQLVIIYAEQYSSGKLGRNRWSITVPHYSRGEKALISAPMYKRGTWCGRLALSDGSSINVNANSSAECKRAINKLKLLVPVSFRTNPEGKAFTPRISENPDLGFKEVAVVPVFARFFATGQKTLIPTWSKSLRK